MLLVKGFFMFFTATERSFTFFDTMLAGRATHKAVFVDSGSNLCRLFPSAFHCYNILHFRVIVKLC